MSDLEFRLQIIKPYRKKLRRGDVFALKFANDQFIHGRIIETEAFWTPSKEAGGHANLIYVYDTISSGLDSYNADELSPDKLLIAPLLINRLGWSKGYLYTVANITVTPSDLLTRHVFEDDPARNLYFDEYGNQVDAWNGPTGTYGLASYGVLEARVSRALTERGIKPH